MEQIRIVPVCPDVFTCRGDDLRSRFPGLGDFEDDDLLVAYSGHKLVGIASFDSDAGVIFHLQVLLKYRGQGIGRRLLSLVIAYCFHRAHLDDLCIYLPPKHHSIGFFLDNQFNVGDVDVSDYGGEVELVYYYDWWDRFVRHQDRFNGPPDALHVMPDFPVFTNTEHTT